MLSRFRLYAALILALAAPGLHAQNWDAVTQAKGWARFDPVGTATFFDAPTRSLVTWTRNIGATDQLDISKAELIPERWLVDDDRIWVMAGNVMKQLDKKGAVKRTVSLPAEVADVDFIPPDGMALVYRTTTPYVERRDIRNGGVVWSYGAKPKKETLTTHTPFRILRNDDGHIMVTGDSVFTLQSLDGKKGTLMGEMMFTYQEKTPPRIAPNPKPRGPLVWRWGTNLAYNAVPASTLPGLGMQGLLVARMDGSASSVEFLPTGLTEDYVLLGILEDRAAFSAPNGGLVFIPVK
ncbi:MAG: hypothetical protein LWX11_08925 [Firmicutes bacterium]|nr:hypothetical protein [Bacillota bacterium]